MVERRPWDRLRSALHREARAPARGPRPLAGVTIESWRAWAFREGLTEDAPEEGLLSVEGGHRLGAVRAYCLLAAEAGPVLALELTVTAGNPGAPPALAAFLLQPLAPALPEPQRSALDTWLRGQLAHRGPYQAATTLPGLQLAIAIDDANQRGRTWTLPARAA